MEAFTQYTLSRIHYNKCSPQAAQHAARASRILTSMHTSRPYYTAHNIILAQSLLIRALLAAGASCKDPVKLLIPGEEITEILANIAEAPEILYKIASEKYPNTLGNDALDALYYMYKVIAIYCKVQTKPPKHETGRMLKKLEYLRTIGACRKYAPKCMPEELKDVGCL